MRIPRLYLDDDLMPDREIELPKDRAHYLLNVLRLADGAELVLFDGRRALDFRARLAVTGRRARVRIDSVSDNRLESPLDSHLLQAVGKPDHVDWLVQKTAELGLRRLTLFNAERTQTPLRGARLEKKLAHWRGVAAAACEQCGRSLLPQIDFAPGLEAAIQNDMAELKLLLDFDGQPLASLVSDNPPDRPSVSCLIGPEGGLNAGEIELARAKGYIGWRLGPRVLRMETAATAALTLLQQSLGDL